MLWDPPKAVFVVVSWGKFWEFLREMALSFRSLIFRFLSRKTLKFTKDCLSLPKPQIPWKRKRKRQNNQGNSLSKINQGNPKNQGTEGQGGGGVGNGFPWGVSSWGFCPPPIFVPLPPWAFSGCLCKARNSEGGNGCTNFLVAWNFVVLSAGKLSCPENFSLLGGGGILAFFWGGGSVNACNRCNVANWPSDREARYFFAPKWVVFGIFALFSHFEMRRFFEGFRRRIAHSSTCLDAYKKWLFTGIYSIKRGSIWLWLETQERPQNGQNVHSFQVRTPICHIVPVSRAYGGGVPVLFLWTRAGLFLI